MAVLAKQPANENDRGERQHRESEPSDDLEPRWKLQGVMLHTVKVAHLVFEAEACHEENTDADESHTKLDGTAAAALSTVDRFCHYY